ncbi:MAG: hypothetical protein JWO12_2985 [Frankiales bacterium]|nr:hypothetical protein [Frankiales bacterium]
MSGTTRSSRLFAVVPLLCLIVSACGSTVSTQQQRAGGDGLTGAPGPGSLTSSSSTGVGSPDQALVGGGLPANADGSSGSQRTGLGASVPGSPSGDVRGGGSSTGAASGQGAANGAASHVPVRVGFEIIKGGNQAFASVFGTPVNFGNGKIEVSSIVKDVNAHGGVGGRPIVPVFGEWNVADGDSGREADCRAMTEDGKVAFIITVVNISQSYVTCAAKHGVPVINASISAGDQDLYRTFSDFLFTPSLMNLNREQQLLLQAQKETGRLGPKVKVGVVIDGTDPSYQRVYDATVHPTLASYGLPHEPYVINTQSDIQGAILRFVQDGVTLVDFIAPSGVSEVLWMNAAEQQAYRPQYALATSSSPWFVSSAAPKNQVKGIAGIGSLPLSDVETSQYPTTPREKHCLDLIRAGGENNAERHGSITATVYCEGIYAFAAVGTRVSGPLTARAFRSAYPTLGTSYGPVVTFATDFSRARHDNAIGYRLLAYTSGCSCVSYTSGVRRVPTNR